MAKKSKLLLALDAQKGRDYDAEKRKKQVKTAEKRKSSKAQNADAMKKNPRSIPAIVAADKTHHMFAIASSAPKAR